MRAAIIFAVFFAFANASVIDKLQKLVPSFATPFVIKGQHAAPNAAPYIVSLSKKDEKHSHICGGTIINKEWVVTAAHCISNPVGMGVIAGIRSLKEIDTTSSQQRSVDFGKVHSGFGGGVGPYDIAILHVSEPFEFNESVQPAVIPARDAIISGNTTLYGWGQTGALNFTSAKILQKLQTEIVDWNECKEILPEDSPLETTNVCSSSLGEGVSACNGDSGGPLVKEVEKGPSQLVGIVSWGYIPCGWANLPSIYTRVSAYTDWLVDIQSAYYKLN